MITKEILTKKTYYVVRNALKDENPRFIKGNIRYTKVLNKLNEGDIELVATKVLSYMERNPNKPIKNLDGFILSTAFEIADAKPNVSYDAEAYKQKGRNVPEYRRKTV